MTYGELKASMDYLRDKHTCLILATDLGYGDQVEQELLAEATKYCGEGNAYNIEVGVYQYNGALVLGVQYPLVKGVTIYAEFLPMAVLPTRET